MSGRRARPFAQRSRGFREFVVPAWVKPGVKPTIDALTDLANAYNLAGNGNGLSSDDSPQLSDEKKGKMVSDANAILTKINAIFTTPICRLADRKSYQVPHDFSFDVQDGYGVAPHEGQLFTITFYNCGRHEIDFVVNNRRAVPLVRRYDGLGVGW